MLATPVAERDWVLSDWFACLAAQTRQPDALVFLHSGRRGDATWEALHDGARTLGAAATLAHDAAAPHQRHDPGRFRTLARLRNRALAYARVLQGADLVLSLDTDVLLEDPETLERLESWLAYGYDVAAPITWLHPGGKGSWAVNAGFLTDRSDDATAGWRRASANEIPPRKALEVGFTFAVQMFGPKVACDPRARYGLHESGEDIAFGQALRRLGARVIWDTSLEARHVWDRADLARS